MMFYPHTRKGFTLIEIIVSMGISAGLIFAIGLFGIETLRISNFIDQKLRNDQDVEGAFRTMVTEIRSMGPSSLGGYPINRVGTSSITFYSDIDKNGIFERVRYFQGTSTFEKGVITPTGNPLVYATSSEVVKTVIQNVVPTSTVFEYFNDSYTGSGSSLVFPIVISDVHIIKMALYVDVKPSIAPQPTYFSNTITIRNLRND